MTERGHRFRERMGTMCRVLGVVLLLAWLVPSLYGMLMARIQVPRFQSAHPETLSWAPGRVNAYRRALRAAMPVPEAVLRIPSAHVEVPVLEGTTAYVLNRAAGHLTGTSAPGGTGNIVIAGHRDGFFRRLRNIAVGDQIVLSRRGGVDTYRVDRLAVVERTDTTALRPTRTPTLTLVTCYPFFYLGPAPQRYVVRASLVAPAVPNRL